MRLRVPVRSYRVTGLDDGQPRTVFFPPRPHFSLPARDVELAVAYELNTESAA